MRHIFDIIIVLILIGFGAVLLTRKKVMISRVVEQNFITFLIFENVIFSRIENEFRGGFRTIVVLICLILMMRFFLKGKYTIYNINQEEATLLVKQILKEKEINFEDRNTLMILIPCDNEKYDPCLCSEMKDYENKEINVHTSFLNSAELDLRQIKGTKMYSYILDEMKIRLKGMEKKFFPYTGVVYIMLGIFFLWMVME